MQSRIYEITSEKNKNRDDDENEQVTYLEISYLPSLVHIVDSIRRSIRMLGLSIKIISCYFI